LKFLPFVALSIVGAGILATDFGFAQNPTTRTTSIFFTQNHKTGRGAGLFAANCLGSVVTETIPSKKGDTIRWLIKQGNGENPPAHLCKGFDAKMVALQFESEMPFGKKILTPQGNVIAGTILSTVPDDTRHKYQVIYGRMAAGPDPEIVVDCSSCGPDEK
jgi:hypothetical protein